MRFMLKAIVILFLMVIAFFMFAPTERVESVKAKWRSAIGDNGQVCFEQWSDKLKDPKSAIVERYEVRNGRVITYYRAKNSYGAYLSGVFECPMKDGKVDERATFSEKVDELLQN